MEAALIHRYVAVAFALTAFAPFAAAGEPSPTSIVGHWIGDARLFDKELRAVTQPLVTELRIAEDLSISGSIGLAQVPTTRPVSATPARVAYRVVLVGTVKDMPQLNKSHLVLIVTRPVSGTLDADFHLKARFGFDPTMRVGHLDVRRLD
jgi:hypothetical protein